MALQQVGPNKLIPPLISELMISIRHPCTLVRTDEHGCMSWFLGNISKCPGKDALLAVNPETCPFSLGDWAQELLSNGAKMSL